MVNICFYSRMLAWECLRRLAIGALFATVGVPALGSGLQAQSHVIWSATMVVGDNCDIPGEDCKWGVSWNGWTNDYEQWGSISSDQFTYGHPIRVKGVWRNAALEDVFFNMDAVLPNHEGMTLSLGSVNLALKDAHHSNGCGSGFKWVGASSVQWTNGDTIAIRLTATDPAPSSPDLAVYFMKANYEATEGGSTAQVEVELKGNPAHDVNVPIGVERYGGADFEDFKLMHKGDVLREHWIRFAEGENRQTIEVMAEDDADDDDQESIALSIGTLECGMMAGNPATAMVALKDNDGVDNNGGQGNVGDGNDGEGDGGEGDGGEGDGGEGDGGEGDGGEGDGGEGDGGEGDGGEGDEGDGDGDDGDGSDGDEGDGDDGGDEDEDGDEGDGSDGDEGDGDGDGDDGSDNGGRDVAPPPTISFLAEVLTVREGQEVSITARLLNTDFRQPVRVPIETTEGRGITSDDYSGVPQSLVFEPGQVVASFILRAHKDGLVENDETVEFSFGTLPSELTGASPGSTRVVIQDLYGRPTVSVGNGLARENRGEMTFAITLSLPSANPVSVHWKTEDGEAVTGEDYESTAGIASFAPGGTGPVVVRVPIIDDAYAEPNETFSVVLSDPGNARIGRAATGGIIDDDQRDVRITPRELVIREAEAGSYSVVLGSAPRDLVTVTMSAAGDTELLLNPASLVFTDADWDTPRTVTVGAPDDDDALVAVPVKITHAVSGGDYGQVSAPSVTVTIAETDLAQLSVGDALAGEGDGEIVFVAELDMPTNRVVDVRWRTGPGTAVDGADYVGARGRLTFPPMETRAEIPVQILDDGMDEADESFVVSLSRVTNAKLGAATATGLIADDDLASVGIKAGVSQVVEGQPAYFNLTRVGDLTAPLSVPVEIDETGDVLEETLPTAATFAVGSATTVLRVATRDDYLDEADAVVEVRILPGDDHAVTAESSATVTVTDNDLPSVSIAAAAEQVTEGDEVRFSVVRLGDMTVALVVPVVVGQTGEVLLGAPPASVMFEAGVDTVVLVVETHDDELDEEDGKVEAVLTDDGGHIVAGARDARVTVADNDAAPTVTILSAQALERAGEIVFGVALGSPSGRTVSVDWATSDGTATARDDYAFGTGTVVIEPGRMADTIRIAIVDDLLDEEDETFSVSLDAPVNILPGTMMATGTIIDDDLPVARAWLSRFGRTVATQVVDAVGDRVYRGYGPGGGFVLGGANHANAGWADLITGSSFRYSTLGQAAPGEAPRGWTIWGRGASTRFSGRDADLSLNGGVLTGFVGIDYQQGPVLAGLLLSHSQGDGDYAGSALAHNGRTLDRGGELESSLTGVHPYLRWNVTDRLSTWGLLGRGWGNMTISDGGHDVGIGMNLGAIGARGALLKPGASGGYGLALRSDAFYTALDSERSAGGLPAEDVNVSRVRLAMEGSRDIVTGGGARIGLALEAGVRRDDGDAETGTGVEMGGRVRYANPARGLSVEASARGLLAHQDEDYEEWGLAGSLLFAPGQAERGLSVRMRTAWGSVYGGVDQLWSQQSVGGLTRTRLGGSDEPEVNAEFNYGVATLGDQTLVTPFANISVAGGQTPSYRLGWRLKVGPSFRLSLENTIGGDRYPGSLAEGLLLRGTFRRQQ